MSDNEKLSLDPETKGPRPARAGGKSPWLPVVLVLLLAGAAAWFWLGKDAGEREAIIESSKEALAEVKDKAGQMLPGAAETTRSGGETRQSMASSGDASGDASGARSGEEPEAGGDGAAPDSGDQAGAGGAGLPEDGNGETPQTAGDLPVLTAPGENREAGPEGPVTRGLMGTDPDQPLPADLAHRDDAVVRVAFIDDLARWMVAGYTPANSRGGRGMISIGIQSANARYGVGMKGLSWIGDNLPAGRAEALRYVYTPSMLDALYRMYIERFMQAMAEASEEAREDGKTLEPVQIAEMYRLYARRFRSLSGTMQGVAALTDLRARVARIQQAAAAMVEANNRYMEEVFAFDQARAGGDEAAIAKARKAMEASSETYQQATYERDRQREALIGAIRNNPEARTFGDDNLLYVAMWVDRRLQQSPQALDATLQAATLFLDLAQRFEQAAGVRQ